MMRNTGVLLVNLGTSEEPTPRAIRRFLREFLSDQRVVKIPKLIWWLVLNAFILPWRPKRLVEKYKEIWMEGGSPLLVYSQSIADKCQQALPENISVKLAMRYGEPSIARKLNEFRKQGVERMLVLPLYPQYAESTTASVFDAVFNELKKWRVIPEIQFIPSYFDNPNYISAIAQQVKTHWSQHGKPDKLIFSYHGLRKKSVEQGDPYQSQCEKTTRLIVRQLQLQKDQWQLVYQSRFGSDEWLQPYCDKTLQELPKQGYKKIDIICPGFAVDCLETLEEIQLTNKEIYLEAGGDKYTYIAALNDSPLQVQLLESLIISRLSEKNALEIAELCSVVL